MIYFFVFSLTGAEAEAAALRFMMEAVETGKQPNTRRTDAAVSRAAGSSPQTMDATAPTQEGAANRTGWGYWRTGSGFPWIRGLIPGC